MSDICSAASPPVGVDTLMTSVHQTHNLLSVWMSYSLSQGSCSLTIEEYHLLSNCECNAFGFSDISKKLLWYMQHTISAGLQKKDHSGVYKHSLRHQPDDYRDHVLSLVFL